LEAQEVSKTEAVKILSRNFIKCAKLYYSGKLLQGKLTAHLKSVNNNINPTVVIRQQKTGSKIDLKDGHKRRFPKDKLNVYFCKPKKEKNEKTLFSDDGAGWFRCFGKCTKRP
jgi:hypothetical protein